MADKMPEGLWLATRPASVIWYERIAVAALAAAAASAFADRATLVKYYTQSPILYPMIVVGVFVAQGAWIWLVARKRKNWARWISIIFTVGSLPSALLDFEARFRFNPAMGVISSIGVVISAIAVSMLPRRDAREWFSAPPAST